MLFVVSTLPQSPVLNCIEQGKEISVIHKHCKSQVSGTGRVDIEVTRKLHHLSRWNQRNLETTGAPDVCSQKAGSVRTATANSITYVRKSINRMQENGCTNWAFPLQKQGGASRCDVALAFSAVQPSLASVDPDDPVSTKVESVISWSTEEKEDICKKKKKKVLN